MTAKYIFHGVKLSPNQKQTLGRAINSRSPVTLRLSNSQLSGPDKLMLTKTQLRRIQKSMKMEQEQTSKLVKLKYEKLVEIFLV